MDQETNETETVTVPEPEISIGPDKNEKVPIKLSRKTIIIILVIIAIGALAYFYRGFFIGAYEYSLNAAIVNGSPISRQSIIQQLEKSYGKNILDSIITDKLIADEAKAKGVAVSDDEVNAEITRVQDQLTAQGSSLSSELAAQGMNMDDFKKQIILRLDLEKLLGDKISVTDQEVEQYIKDNKITIPAGQEAVARAQIKTSLKGQKLNNEAPNLIDELKSKANIKYYVNY